MNGLLNIGTSLQSESSNTYEVIGFLGAGGQGEVYEVDSNGKRFALKWYFKHMATERQKNILNNLIKNESPSSSFLWPEDIVVDDDSGIFGYIMPLRPKHYKSIVDMMKRRAEPSFEVLCKAAYNLTYCYRKLHIMGYSYRDISFGNLFFDPDNGDVLICDNDNVSANGIDDSSVYGTPRFMAPEIVVGKEKPSRNTDLYSLSVLLFYMFMMGHPLEGKLEADIKCMDIHAMNKLYGTNPIFVFDPNDKSNRPVKGYQDNVLIFWDIYPKKLKELFTTAFTDGIHYPNKRITEKQWMDIFANLITGISYCDKCGAEVFYDECKVKQAVAPICWNCGTTKLMPLVLSMGKFKILLNKDAKIYSHNIKNDFDMNTVVGRVVQNPKNPNVWGIKNESDVNWTYIKADGTQLAIGIGKSATISKNVKINFGKVIGEIL